MKKSLLYRLYIYPNHRRRVRKGWSKRWLLCFHWQATRPNRTAWVSSLCWRLDHSIQVLLLYFHFIPRLLECTWRRFFEPRQRSDLSKLWMRACVAIINKLLILMTWLWLTNYDYQRFGFGIWSVLRLYNWNTVSEQWILLSHDAFARCPVPSLELITLPCTWTPEPSLGRIFIGVVGTSGLWNRSFEGALQRLVTGVWCFVNWKKSTPNKVWKLEAEYSGQIYNELFFFFTTN